MYASVVTSMVMVLSSAALDVRWLSSTCETPADLRIDGSGRAEVRIVEAEGGWDVAVLLEPDGSRRVLAKTCEEAVRAATLLLELGARRPPPAAAAEPDVATFPATVTMPASPPVPWRFSLSAGAALDVGSMPVVEPRFALSGAASRGLLRLAADVRVGLPVSLNETVRAQRAIELLAAGCLNFATEFVSISPCVAATVGTWAVPAATRGVATLGPQLRVSAIPFASVELGAVLGARVNLVRPVPFTDEGVVFTTSLLSADFQLTAGWRW